MSYTRKDLEDFMKFVKEISRSEIPNRKERRKYLQKIQRKIPTNPTQEK